VGYRHTASKFPFDLPVHLTPYLTFLPQFRSHPPHAYSSTYHSLLVITENRINHSINCSTGFPHFKPDSPERKTTGNIPRKQRPASPRFLSGASFHILYNPSIHSESFFFPLPTALQLAACKSEVSLHRNRLHYWVAPPPPRYLVSLTNFTDRFRVGLLSNEGCRRANIGLTLDRAL